MSIPTDAIEAAARALFAVENCDRRQMLDVQSNWRGRLNDANREEYRILATAALTAAAPAIQAAALRDAAVELCTEKCDDNYDPDHCETCRAAETLHARADQLEGETK